MHKLVKNMTLEEKASLTSGGNFWNTQSIDRLNIKPIMMTDGPHGLRKQGGKADHLGLHKSLPATCFPTAATLANSWDKDLLEEVGKSLGTEAAKEEVSILLGPGMNIKRNPLDGRNFEYFSEDPYLSGKLSVSMIQGIQSQGVAACAKHFAVNSQELHRMSVDEIVDQRALHEIYLESFRHSVIDGKVQSIMTAYNKINGTYANEHPQILSDILRDTWGFKGLVVTDWGGNNDRVAALKAGNHLEMPSTNGMTNQDIIKAIKEDKLKEETLDKSVSEYLNFYDQIQAQKKSVQFDKNQSHKMAQKAARESLVLLKNNNKILPLKKEEKVVVIGDFAKNPRYQGAGSSLINPFKVESFLEIMEDNNNLLSYHKGFHRYGKQSKRLKNRAVIAAEKADKIILFVGLDESSESEGVDRKHMRLPQNQLDLIEALTQLNKPIILLLAGGSVIELPFIDRITACVHTYLPGQGGGQAIYDVLYGNYNPSGKLSETYPYTYQSVVNKKYYPGKEVSAEHRESIFVGYRYYDTYKKSVLYPFGYGLSYTEFKYESLEYENKQLKVKIKNVGAYDGAEVIQIYIQKEGSDIARAEKELKGFKKVYLKQGETKTVCFDINTESFEMFDPLSKKWIIEAGKYNILVGSSSRDIRLKASLKLKGIKLNPDLYSDYNNYFKQDPMNASSDTFQSIIDYKLPNPRWDHTEPLGLNHMIKQSRYRSRFGRFINWSIEALSKFFAIINKPNASNNMIFAQNLPFRGVARMSAGMVNMEMLDGLIMMFDGHFFKGSSHFISEWIKK